MLAMRTSDARPNLERIREQDDLGRGRDHGSLGIDLLEAGIGQARLDRDAVGGQERLVDVDLPKGRRSQLAAGAERLGPDDAPGHDHRGARIAHQLHGIGDRRGDHDEVATAPERPRQGQRRGTRIEDDRAAIDHQLRRASADGQLLGCMLAESLGGARLVGRPCRDRTTTRSPDHAHLRQSQQVAPDGLVRDAQHLHEVAATHAAAFADEVRDHLEPVGRQQLGAVVHGSVTSNHLGAGCPSVPHVWVSLASVGIARSAGLRCPQAPVSMPTGHVHGREARGCDARRDTLQPDSACPSQPCLPASR